MNITLEPDGVHIKTDSSGNKLIFKQGINNSLTFAEYTGTATFSSIPIHPTPASSANDTQSATTEYVRTYIGSVGSTSVTPITDQASAIFPIKASTVSLDCILAKSGSPLISTDVVFTAIYLTEGIQFNKYNFIAGGASKIPLRLALFSPSGDYVINSDTVSYNNITPTSGALLTSTLSNTVTIATTGIHYIFYQSNGSVNAGLYYSSTAQTTSIVNSWRSFTNPFLTSGFRSCYISGASNSIVPSTYGNIKSKTLTGLLAVVNFIFLT